MIIQWLLAAQSTAKHSYLSPFAEEKPTEHVQVEELSFG